MRRGVLGVGIVTEVVRRKGGGGVRRIEGGCGTSAVGGVR